MRKSLLSCEEHIRRLHSTFASALASFWQALATVAPPGVPTRDKEHDTPSNRIFNYPITPASAARVAGRRYCRFSWSVLRLQTVPSNVHILIHIIAATAVLAVGFHVALSQSLPAEAEARRRLAASKCGREEPSRSKYHATNAKVTDLARRSRPGPRPSTGKVCLKTHCIYPSY